MTKQATYAGAGTREGPTADPDCAALLRHLSTALGMHRHCPLRACKRRGACAGHDVLCYRENQEALQPIAASLVARVYEREIDAGRDPEIAPAHAGDQVRRMAYEAAEIPRILAGAYGGDADLTPYQLWMKYWIAPTLAARAARTRAARASQQGGEAKGGEGNGTAGWA